jgi:chromosome condensin MukBEF complex kleisin-like MukF subunit
MDATAQATVGGFRGSKYKSPLRALARFFRMSRDRWKAKAQELKTEQKRLKNRVADARRSREDWKTRAQAVELQLAEERAKNLELQDLLAAATAEKKGA